jgi:hypothetical protein
MPNYMYDEEGKLRPNLRGVSGDQEIAVWTDSDGELHRADGPAVEYRKGQHKAWFRHGKRHREDGPAIIYGDGRCSLYIHNQLITTKEWMKWIKSGQSTLDQKTINRLILENS